MCIEIDDKIVSTCFMLDDWPLSRVFLKDEASYPWLILVPRVTGIQEIYQLDKEQRAVLMEEIYQLSGLIQDYFKPEKLNVASIGNIVSQLHVHLVGRNTQDPLWPQSIWQASMQAQRYDTDQLDRMLPGLRKQTQARRKLCACTNLP